MRVPLIATSHGTKFAEAREAITALVDAVRTASPHLDVHEAFVDVQLPRIDSAVEQVGGPAVIVPLLLAPGFHVRVDVEHAAARDGVVAASTLGADDRLTRVMLTRLAEVGATRDDVVVLGAAGSTDAGARRSVDRAARMLAARWGSVVPVGYVGGSGTPITDIVDVAGRAGRRVVVVSYLMAPGYFHTRLTQCGAPVVTRPILDGRQVDPHLVSLVLDRFATALGQLNCVEGFEAVEDAQTA